jgi:phospholipase C
MLSMLIQKVYVSTIFEVQNIENSTYAAAFNKQGISWKSFLNWIIDQRNDNKKNDNGVVYTVLQLAQNAGFV